MPAACRTGFQAGPDGLHGGSPFNFSVYLYVCLFCLPSYSMCSRGLQKPEECRDPLGPELQKVVSIYVGAGIGPGSFERAAHLSSP